jgi:hypothetical protein
VLLWFARYFAASAFGFAIFWLLGFAIKSFFNMEKNVLGKREASGKCGCFVLSRSGFLLLASCALCAARCCQLPAASCCFCFHFHPSAAANQDPHRGRGGHLRTAAALARYPRCWLLRE